ncbi:sugar nucleotide-binding protein [Micrococcus sp. TA1]|uniref:sugar nucleotide-binding protein n=1 Tax=Micrococcus sp. TA1 TaxID=681627 RepID=UPI001616FF7E|nr:sugar nucleotide-binding protein [Micrococcus sp. TA1]MBB5747947.1 nucleoside-diphosphate-sugar epimerase [Micrococcus sp. TA1]
MPDAPSTLNEEPGRILLVGCGKLGTRLGRRLVDAGWEVLALRRHPGSLPPEFSTLAIDLQEPAPHAMPEVEAMVITLPPGARDTGDCSDGYRTPLYNLAAALPSVPGRVVFVSSTRVFEGSAHHRALTEVDSPAPVTARGEALRDGELLAADMFGARILRPAGIYGPGREMLVRRVLEGTPVQYARRTNRIHETDLVRALEAILGAADPPRVLHAVDQKPALLGEVVEYIARCLRVPAPPRVHPEAASGTTLDGTRLLRLLGTLEYPTFETRYAQLITARQDESTNGNKPTK